ncbi:hypothetical protein F2Q70_00012042 [Brassica cretica]|uniref:Uncharacterized protein n=1 Tax=Brassica cretica TaxID=69181 RepID=A0A8S9LTQ7_BRACR|nr:hypothetical protein F2Q70_00012042 [Brassica cretica]
MSIDYDNTRSIDDDDSMSIDTSDILSEDTNPKTLTFDIKVNVAHNMLYPDRDSPMYERRTKRSFDVGGTSAAPPPPPAHDQYPWQGEHEDEPFPLFDHFDDTRKVAKSAACRNRAIGEAWDDYDSILYNVWLKVSIEPTWFVDPDVVRALGIRSDLEDLFVELGMGNFATHPQILYPELVRQFMKASESVLTFFICGIRYRG